MKMTRETSDIQYVGGMHWLRIPRLRYNVTALVNIVIQAYLNNRQRYDLSRRQGKLKQNISESSWERIIIDILGLFPITASVNRKLMISLKNFSKWSTVELTPKQIASLVTEVLLENVIARHGVPQQELDCDHGRNFE